METTLSTPIWLDMRTEYIDANFEKFIDYLYSNRNREPDTFYSTSIKLLRERVEEIISITAGDALSSQDIIMPDGDDRERILLWIRIIGAYLLLEEKSNRAFAKRAFIYQLLLLVRACPSERTEELSSMTLSLLVGNDIFVTGYSWSDIKNFYPEVLVSKILAFAGSGKGSDEERWYEGNGCARIHDGAIQIMNIREREDVKKQQVSIGVCDNTISIMSPQSQKLKQSQQKDLSAIAAFTKEYQQNMMAANLLPAEQQKKHYRPDAEKAIDIRITNVSYNGITAVTVDKDYYPLQGQIAFKNTLCLNMVDLRKAWKAGDELPCRIKSIDSNGKAVFDVTDEIIKFVVTEGVRINDITRGIVLKVDHGMHTMWLTDMGVPMYTQNKQYEPGTMAELHVTGVSPNGYIRCFVDAIVDADEFDNTESQIELLRSYTYEKTEHAGDSDAIVVGKVEYADLRAAMVCIYLKQRIETEPLEKYRLLCALQIMCKLVGDDTTGSFIHFMTQYLGNVMYFAKGQFESMYVPKIEEAIKDDAGVMRRMEILEVLRCYGKEEMEAVLEKAIENQDKTINHLAKVIQSCNRLEGILSDAMRNAIMHEMLKMLKIDDNSAADLEDEGGIYLGIENGHQEFKTSFIYPPDYQMLPAPEIQKMNVFKAVCAFLNSENGGVVYLGVNDLGTVTGIEDDLQYLKCTLDGYMRYINDEAKNIFGLGILTFINIQEMYNERVVAINVKPCDYKVVELNGKAYIRTNAESREMTKSVRLRVEERRRTYDKNRAESVSALQTAIANRRQVIVHGYSSSNGGSRRDRNLEPFSFTNGMKHIWCFDLDDKIVKLFSVSRITNVEILDKEWSAAEQHKEGKMDIFYMTGDEAIKVSLELDRMAYNLIVEEFPESKNYLEESGNDMWQLSTSVCSLQGVGRFYTGLADHISIIEAPELESYARGYFKRHI